MHLEWSCALEAVIMSRMAKDRGEVRTGSSRERHTLRSRHEASSPPFPALEGDFERAFADALRDILRHEHAA
jgi:hypothetical protein